MSRAACRSSRPLTFGDGSVTPAYGRQNRRSAVRESGSNPAVCRSIFRNVHHRQIQHLEKTVICRKDGFCLRHCK